MSGMEVGGVGEASWLALWRSSWQSERSWGERSRTTSHLGARWRDCCVEPGRWSASVNGRVETCRRCVGRGDGGRHTGAGGHRRRRVEPSWQRWRCLWCLSRLCEKCGGNGLSFGYEVSLLGLGGQLTLREIAVPIALTVLPEGVLDRNFFREDILAMEVLDSSVAAFEIAKTDEAEPFAHTAVITGDLGQRKEGTEAAEGIVEDFLVHHGIKIAHEELGADVGRLLLVGRGLVDTQALSVELDAVDHIRGVLGVGWGAKLYEAKALVGLRDTIARHVNVLDRAHLEHDFIHHGGGGTLVNVANIHCSLFILLPVEMRLERRAKKSCVVILEIHTNGDFAPCLQY